MLPKDTKQRRLEPDEDDRKDGITFDKQGRMQYNPSFHTNHGKPFSVSDLIYLCKYYTIDGPRTIGFALGKTEHTIMGRVAILRKENLYEYYKNISDDEWLTLEKGG
jgi:hypothetical protein